MYFVVKWLNVYLTITDVLQYVPEGPFRQVAHVVSPVACGSLIILRQSYTQLVQYIEKYT